METAIPGETWLSSQANDALPRAFAAKRAGARLDEATIREVGAAIGVKPDAWGLPAATVRAAIENGVAEAIASRPEGKGVRIGKGWITGADGKMLMGIVPAALPPNQAARFVRAEAFRVLREARDLRDRRARAQREGAAALPDEPDAPESQGDLADPLPGDPFVPADVALMNAEEHQAFLSLLGLLPHDDRVLVDLHLDGVTTERIAARLGYSDRTIRRRLAAITDRLRRLAITLDRRNGSGWRRGSGRARLIPAKPAPCPEAAASTAGIAPREVRTATPEERAAALGSGPVEIRALRFGGGGMEPEAWSLGWHSPADAIAVIDLLRVTRSRGRRAETIHGIRRASVRDACTCGAGSEAPSVAEATPMAEATPEAPYAIPARPRRQIVLTRTRAPRVTAGGRPIAERVFPW